jgi:hypothetical protein
MHSLGKRADVKASREFESPPLRIEQVHLLINKRTCFFYFRTFRSGNSPAAFFLTIRARSKRAEPSLQATFWRLEGGCKEHTQKSAS